MHRKYGPVVQIMPNVVHVNDPSFIDTLYPLSPHQRRERSWTVLNMFTTHNSVLPTRDHDLHRQRRAVISRFFSQQNVRRLVPVINDTLEDLFQRMENWSKTDSPIQLNAPYKAATKDVIQAYAFGDGAKFLHMEDCNEAFFETINPGRATQVSVHFHSLLQFMAKLPPPIILALSPQVATFAQFVQVTAQCAECDLLS